MDMGHHRIGFVGGALDIANMRDRYDGYLEQMERFGLEVDRDWVIDDLAAVAQPNGVEGTWRLLWRRNLPTAIITATESVTKGEKAADLLMDLIHEPGNPDPNARVLEPLTLIVRDSVRPCDRT
ncbi:MAG: hypothetical protein ACOC7V_01915 [Spirochaetota bacterium]